MSTSSDSDSSSEYSDLSPEEQAQLVMKEIRKVQRSSLVQEHSVSRKIARIQHLLPPLHTWAVIEFVCYKLGSFWDVDPSSEDSGVATTASLRRDRSKMAILRHEIAFDLIRWFLLASNPPAGGSGGLPGWGFPLPDIPGVSQVHLVFHYAHYTPEEREYLVGRSDFAHADERVFIAVFDSDTPNEEREIENIDRHQILWIGPKEMIPIMQINVDRSKAPAAILWRDNENDGFHDRECRYYSGGGGSGRGRGVASRGHGSSSSTNGNWNRRPAATGAGTSSQNIQRPMCSTFPGYKKFCLDRHAGESKYVPNSSALYIRADIVDQPVEPPPPRQAARTREELWM